MTGETKNRWGVIAGLLLAMILGLSGCGGFGDTGSPPANQGRADSAELGSGAGGGYTPIEGPGVQALGEYSQYGQTPPAEVSGNDASGAGQAGFGTNAITSERPHNPYCNRRNTFSITFDLTQPAHEIVTIHLRKPISETTT